MVVGTPKVGRVPGRNEYNANTSHTGRRGNTGTYAIVMYPYRPVFHNICMNLGEGTKGGRIYFEFWHLWPLSYSVAILGQLASAGIDGNASAGTKWRLCGNAINIDGGGRTGGFSLTNLRFNAFLMG